MAVDVSEIIAQLKEMDLTAQAAELEKLTGKQLEAIQASTEASEQLVELATKQKLLLEDEYRLRNDKVIAIRNEIEEMQRALVIEDTLEGKRLLQKRIREETLELQRAEMAALEAFNALYNETSETLSRTRRTSVQMKSTFEELTGIATDMSAQGEKLAAAMLNSSDYSSGLVGKVANLAKKLEKAAGKKGAKGLAAALGGMAAGIGMGIVNAIIGVAFAVDKMTASFRQATGASEKAAASLTAVYEETRELGVSTEEASKSMQSLWMNTTGFSRASSAAQIEMGNTVAMLGEFGVAVDDVTKGMEISMKVFGQSGQEAAKTARELNALALQIGVAPQQMARDFAAAGNSIAKLGSQGEQAFKDLARRAKITGMELGKMLKVVEKFDTFEGAAEAAGMLNAAIGTNAVNAMDMMMETDPSARFDALRGALQDAGLEFDNMSYYQRKFYAQAMGLDSVADLAMMMSGNYEELNGEMSMTSAEYEEQARKAQEMKDMQEKLNNALMKMVPILVPLIEKLTVFLEETLIPLLEDWGEWFMWIGLTSAALYVLAPIVKAIGLAFGFIAKVMPAAAAGQHQGARGTDDLANSARRGAPSLTALSLSILAVGAAVLMIGGGIYFAATGMANLVTAFDEAESGWAAGAAIMVVAKAVGLLVFALTKMNALSGPAMLSMLALGAAVFGIGAGIGIAASGLAEMATALADMDSIGLQNFAIGVGLMAAAFVGLAGAVAAFGNPITAAGAAVLGTIAIAGAAVMKLFGSDTKQDTTNYQGMATALEALSGMGGIRELREVRSVFEGMREAINDTNPLTLGMAAMMFEKFGGAVAEVATAAPVAGAQGSAPMSAGGGDSYTVTMPIYIGDEKFDEKVYTIAEGAAQEVYDQNSTGAVNP